jgi:hypothetical protein
LECAWKTFKSTSEAIMNFDEDAARVNVQEHCEGSTFHHFANYQHNHQLTFNPIDKFVGLNEALFKSEKKEIELIRKILDKF